MHPFQRDLSPEQITSLLSSILVEFLSDQGYSKFTDQELLDEERLGNEHATLALKARAALRAAGKQYP